MTKVFPKWLSSKLQPNAANPAMSWRALVAMRWGVTLVVIATTCLGLVTACDYSSEPNATAKADVPKEATESVVSVSIHYIGSGATFSSWLTLSKGMDGSHATYVVENAIVDVQRPDNVAPVVPWGRVWAELSKQKFYDLKGEGHDPDCPERVVAPLDPDIVSVEIHRGSETQNFSYSFPVYAKCDGTKRFQSVVEFLHDAFGSVLPIPR